MKRSIWLLLLLGVLIACGGGSESEQNDAPAGDDAVEVVEQNSAESTDDPAPTSSGDPDDRIVVKFAVDEFQMGSYGDLIATFEEENPDIEIKLVSADDVLQLDPQAGAFEAPDDAGEKLARAADVIATQIGGFSAEDVERGLIIDLAPLIEGDSSFNRDDFWPALWPDSGAIAIIPTGVNFNLVFYDKEKFDAAGFDYPATDWTWDDFRQTAEALTVRSGNEVEQWGYVQPFPNPYLFIQSRIDTQLIDQSTNPPTVNFDEDEVVDALQWYVDLYEVDASLPTIDTPDEDESTGFVMPEGLQMIEDGKAAMWEDFSGAFGFRRGGADTVGIAPFPTDDGRPSTPIFVNGMSISAGSANPQAAWKWAGFLSTQEQPQFGFGGATQLPVRQSLAESSGFWDEVNPELGAAMRVAIGNGLQAYNGEALSSLFEAFDDVLTNGTPVEDALATAQADAEATIEEADSAEKVDAFSVIASAQEQTANSDAATISFVTIGAGFDLGQYRDLALAFTEQNPDIVVEILPPDFAGGTGVFNMQTIAENTDCFQWFSEVQNPDAQAAILPLDPFIEADSDVTLDDFYPALVDQFRVQGQLWGLPAEITPMIIEYNRDLFDEFGVDYPALGWTMDNFVDLAIDTTEGDGEFKTWGFVPDAFENNILLLMIERRGAQIIDTSIDPPTMSMTHPDTVSAMRWYADLHTQLGVKPAFITDPSDFSRGQGLFADREGIIDEGRAGMWTTSGFGGGGIGLGDRSSMNIGYAPMPLGPGGAGLTPADGYFISAETTNRRACWEWIKFLSASPDVVTGLPGRIAVAESAEYRDSVGAEKADAYLASIDSLGDSESTIFRLFSGDNDWMGVGTFWLGRANQDVIDGEKSVEEALDAAQVLFDNYRSCIITNDAFNDNDAQNECLEEVDPTLPTFLTGG